MNGFKNKTERINGHRVELLVPTEKVTLKDFGKTVKKIVEAGQNSD